MSKAIKIILAVIIVIAVFAAGTLFGKTLSKTDTKTETTQASTTQSDEQTSQTDTTAVESTTSSESIGGIKVTVAEDGFGKEFGKEGAKAKITGAKVAKADKGNVLIIKFDYTNNSDKAKCFINDYNCNVMAYQDGIELDDPGITSQSGVYDYNDAFTMIKSGATISTELVFVLRNTTSAVELELGNDEQYNPQIKTKVSFEKEQ